MTATLLELDPTITADDVAAAHDATPTSFADILAAQDDLGAQQDMTGLGAGTMTPATPAQAIANARALSKNGTYVGVGRCLETVRMRYFEIGPLYPDANTEWERTFGKHPETDPAKFPRGSVGYAVNERYGHVWLNVGGGMCWTTDYRRPGQIDLAPISAMAPWIGGRLVGWAEGLEGVDVWPFDVHGNPIPKPPRPTPNRDEKLRMLHALLRAAKAAGQDNRVRLLQGWIAKLEKGQK